MTQDYYLATNYLQIIDEICNLSTYPDQLHTSKLFLLTKKPFINAFDELRSINISNNIKNIINKMRHSRAQHHYIDLTGEDHGAYVLNIGRELMIHAFHSMLHDVECRYGQVYTVLSDLYKV